MRLGMGLLRGGLVAALITLAVPLAAGLAVITADAYGIRRPDGVWEIPVRALAP